MAELLGFTGAIGSGKTTFAKTLCEYEPSHTWHETHTPIIEIANKFNYFLRREWGARRTSDDFEVINQMWIRFLPSIKEHLHYDATWTQLAVSQQMFANNPEQYERLYNYLQTVHANPSHMEVTITSENKAEFRTLLQWLGAYFVEKLSPTIWLDEIMRRVDLYDNDKRLIIVSGVRYLADAEVIRRHGGKIIKLQRPSVTDDTTDATEREHNKIRPDITILNNGSAADLRLTAERLWDDLAAGVSGQLYVTDVLGADEPADSPAADAEVTA